MGKTQKRINNKNQNRTNHHKKINNFMAWEALNWHRNSWTAFQPSPKRMDWILWRFSLSLSFQMWSTHHTSSAAPQRLPRCKPSVKAKSSSTRRLSLLKSLTSCCITWNLGRLQSEAVTMLGLKITWQDWAPGFSIFYIIMVLIFLLLKIQ